MIPNDIKKYFRLLLPLTKDKFQEDLLSASLDNLLDKANKLRFNNFSCGIRELSRHLLASLGPDEEIEKCCWYRNESKKKGSTTRAEKVKYAIQKGLPDSFVSTHLDTAEHQQVIRETMEILNKYTHVNSDTFDIPESKIDMLVKAVLNAYTNLATEIDSCDKLLKQELEEHIDRVLAEHTINETFDEVDILSTHHNIEDVGLENFKVTSVNSSLIIIESKGFVDVRHQFGSDSDFEKGDGAEVFSSFPFDCDLEISIDNNFPKGDYTIKNFKIDTDSWYK